jgi:HAD superfamily hydrolase (TIGR01509 family)
MNRKSCVIKAILFDLDGVLVNTRILHFETFKKAFEANSPGSILTWNEHLIKYDGLSTKQKLKKMIDDCIILEKISDKIFQDKQSITSQYILEQVKPRPYLIELLTKLKESGYILACCTNATRKSLDLTLESLQISSFFTQTLSNNDVEQQKPHPEIYTKCMELLGVSAQETLICEDSPHGRKAAYASGCHVLEIEDAEDLTYDKISQKISTIQSVQSPETKQRINIVIPMAGEGSRFQKAGYKDPKPFILVRNIPMIQWVIENTMSASSNLDLHYIFICRSSHLKQYPFSSLLNSLNIQHTIIPIDYLTSGAACTVLLAKESINNDCPMVIVNSDQYLEWDSTLFLKKSWNSGLSPNKNFTGFDA